MSGLRCSGAGYFVLFCFAVTQLLRNIFLDLLLKQAKMAPTLRICT